MGAFNNSPGGCCCGTNAGFFDVFFWTKKAGKLSRWTTLYQPGKLIGQWNSTDPGAIDWWIDYYDLSKFPIVNGAYNGLPANDRFVYTNETRYNSSNVAETFIVKYDSLNRSQVWAIKVPLGFGTTSPPLTRSHRAMWLDMLPGYAWSPVSGSVTGSELVIYEAEIDRTGNGTLHKVNDAGYSATPAKYKNTSVNEFFDLDYVIAIAGRAWPRAAGGRLQNPNSGNPQSDLFIGNADVANGRLVINNKQTVVSGTGGVIYSWVSFDATFSEWAGVVYKWDRNSSTGSVLFLINGSIVKSIPYSKGDPALLGNAGIIAQLVGRDIVQQVHVCHPHEVISGTFVAFAVNKYYTEGGSPSYVWEIDFYRDGQPSWKTGRIYPVAATTYPPFIVHSADRWLYIDNGERAGYHSTIADHWRHDGSAKWQTGHLQPDGTVTPIVLGDNVLRFYDAVVQNSASLKNALPLEYPVNVS